MSPHERGLATGRLADLARAGYLGLPQPSMRVEYEIHHLVDGPGRLVDILDGAAGFAETLSAGGHGVGVVVGTRVAAHPTHATWSPGPLTPAATARTFRGSARPNPTFLYGGADRFDAVVCIEDEPRRITLRHGVALRAAMAEVARISLQEQAPLLSLQCPAQIPPHTSRRVVRGAGTRVVDSSRSSSLALRFSMALARPRAQLRLRIAERLAGYCRERGLGLWLADTRAGYRDGDWFIVISHDRTAARRGYAAGTPMSGNPAEGCLPVTLVGPARSGSTQAVAAFLAHHPTASVLACSMTPLDDLAFVHLQLAVPRASHRRLAAINRALAERGDGGGPVALLPHVLSELLGCPADGDLDTARTLAAAEDHEIALGPALPVAGGTGTVALPAWFSWSMRPAADGTGLRVLLRTFAGALAAIGLGSGIEPAPSIEYLVCRQVEPSRLVGKGKLAVTRDELAAQFPASRSTGSAGRMCNALESAWRARLTADPDGGQITSLSVSWRESWLGHWT